MARGEAEKGKPESPMVEADSDDDEKDAEVGGDTETDDEGKEGEKCSMDEVALSAAALD